MTTTKIKRGTKVTYQHAGGKVVPGVVLGSYSEDMPGWYRVKLTDEAGSYVGGCHREQITITDNRPNREA